MANTSSESFIEKIVGSIALAALAHTRPDLPIPSLLISTNLDFKPDVHRIVSIATLTGENLDVVIGDEPAQTCSVDLTFEMPPSDPEVNAEQYQSVVNTVVSYMTQTNRIPNVDDYIDRDDLGQFDLLIVLAHSGTTSSVDNDRISYTATFSVIFHRITL